MGVSKDIVCQEKINEVTREMTDDKTKNRNETDPVLKLRQG